MKYLLMVAFAVVSTLSHSQSSFYGSGSSTQFSRMANETSALMTDAMGQPFYPQQKYNWEGKLFFPDNYTNATITAGNGKVYRNIKAKINLLDHTVLFTDSANREFVVSQPLDKIEFDNPLGEANHIFIKPQRDTARTLYHLLDSGKATLLKKITITYKDQSAYGSTMVTRIFEQKYSYYAIKDGVLVSIDKTKTALLEIFSDKRQQVDAYLDKENLKLRKEEDMIKLFRYYNSM